MNYGLDQQNVLIIIETLLDYAVEDQETEGQFKSMQYYTELDLHYQAMVASHFRKVLTKNPFEETYWWVYDRVIREKEGE